MRLAAYDLPLPPYLNALTDERATQAAYDAIASGTYPPLHEVSSSPRIIIGAQLSAGILFPFEDSPAGRAATLATLRASRISTIVCCSADSPSLRIFEGDGISYASALLNDGDAAGKAACASTLCALVERALPLVHAAFARGEGVHRSGSVAIAHHRFECNYGGGVADFDRLCGTFIETEAYRACDGDLRKARELTQAWDRARGWGVAIPRALPTTAADGSVKKKD